LKLKTKQFTSLKAKRNHWCYAPVTHISMLCVHRAVLNIMSQDNLSQIPLSAVTEVKL